MLQLPSCWKLYAICSFVAIGGFLYGYDNGTISACLIMSDFQVTFSLDDTIKTAAVVSAPLAASSLASILSGTVADAIGRKRFFFVSAFLHLIGTIIQLCSGHLTALIVGRIITGISIGVFSFLVPLYQSEIAKPEHRGRLINLYQFGVTLGFCVAFWIGYGTFDLPRHLSWQIPLGAQIGPAVVMILGLRWCIPESPRWLIYRGRKEEADAILSNLRMKGHLNDKEQQLQQEERYYHQQRRQKKIKLQRKRLEQQQQQQQQKPRSSYIGSNTVPPSSSPILPSHDDSNNNNNNGGDDSSTILSPISSLSSSLTKTLGNVNNGTDVMYRRLEALEMEYLGIIQDVTFERQCSSRSYSALLTKGIDNYRKRILLGMGLHIMTQFTGINAILFYLPHILESMGLAQMNSVLFGNGVSGMVNMLATIPVFFYIDRWDRRRILMIGASSMSLVMAVIALVLGIHSDHTESNNQPLYPGSVVDVAMIQTNEQATLSVLVLLCLFLSCFAMSWGTIPWLYNSEIFNQSIRAKAMGVTTGSMFAFSILISQVAPLVFESVGWRSYIIFSCLCIITVFIVHGCYPETKGKTFEEIQLIFSGALIDQSPKAHHPSTAAEAWEKVEIICHHLPIMMKQVTTTASATTQHQQQPADDDVDGTSFKMTPIIQKTYDTNVQQKFEAILEEKNRLRKNDQHLF
ncbi:major facilitator superfamily domain-containing protein [Halteromyces radiatus]|uniref:major facilitator superfamily domain-containing protein n=1 Tax=Halteromyces radiatus TaxID=101107 RepID=UPI002220AE7E|nr:major facilitator superfamily domain-containing protein [Halteromyces radiatus]KAI8084766.1 major facilitator superfamily domain-containing protein [Halteromyces radiatus]